MGSTYYRFCLNQPSDDPAARAKKLSARYQRIRLDTERLCEPLSPEDCTVQSMPDASLAKWHLAHTSWFFETFVLTPHVPGYREFHPQYRALFNSYYHTVGDQYPRPQRGLLTRPALDEVRAYRAHVDHHMLGLMKTGGELDSALAQLIVLGFNHEQQHQELILTDIKHMFFCNPLRPAYQDRLPLPPCEPSALSWHRYEEGLRAKSGSLQPSPARGQISASAPVQLFGDVWEWTQSPYTPYPGYQLPSGALGEYNGKFMCNQIVLRGGSCATPCSHIRRTYRNFFYPEARWQFSGIRLARDV